MTGRVTPVIARVLREHGYDVRVVQPQDGAGMFNGDVSDVGETVVAWSQRPDHWTAGVYVEIHGQALGAKSVRGEFGIYPDAPEVGDVDTRARDLFGPRLTREITIGTGIPSLPMLSEQKTQVGLDGFRLGIFSATASLKQTVRMIAEIGTYTNVFDKAIMDSPAYAESVALAFLRTLNWFKAL